MRHNWLILRINRQQVVKHVATFRGTFLDIGCGETPYRGIIEPRVSRYVGLDHRDTQHRADAVDVWGSATNLPFEAETFDSAAAFQVLEHIPEPATALAEAFRVLRPGGMLYISTPFIWGVHEDPVDFYRYTHYGLRHLLSEADFEVVSVEAVCGFWATFGLRLSYYLERFARGPLAYAVAPFQVLLQFTGMVLDQVDRAERDAAGYVMVARKPSSLA